MQAIKSWFRFPKYRVIEEKKGTYRAQVKPSFFRSWDNKWSKQTGYYYFTNIEDAEQALEDFAIENEAVLYKKAYIPKISSPLGKVLK
jgi:hypothetical protein